MSNITELIEGMNREKMRGFLLTLKEKTFIHLNIFMLLNLPSNTSNYFLYKTRQPITGRLYVEDKVVELPMCKLYNFYSVGLFIGYIFEIPRHLQLEIADNYVMIIKGKPPKKRGVSNMLYTNQNLNIYGMADRLSLICSNEARYATLKR